MDTREQNVLTALRFETVPTEKTLWSGTLHHIEGLNQHIYDLVGREIFDLKKDRDDSPPGLVVHGEYGMGKSHLVWWSRKLIAGYGGYYFNIQPDGSAETLWTRVMSSMLDNLCDPTGVASRSPGMVTQLSLIVDRLSKQFGIDERGRAVLSGKEHATRDETDTLLTVFTDGLRDRHRSMGLRNTGLALVLLALKDDDANAAGDAFLRSSNDERQLQRDWGLRSALESPQDVVNHLSRVIAMTGPSLFVVDQIDDLVRRSSSTTERHVVDDSQNDLAAELMTVREKLTRSITLICCLDHTWLEIQRRAVRSALDRFRAPQALEPIPSAEVGRRLIAALLAPQFDELVFTPPYDTWPVPTEAFDSAKGFRPRQLINLVEKHVDNCRKAGRVLPLAQIVDVEKTTEPAPSHEDTATSVAQKRFLDHYQSVKVDELKEAKGEALLGNVLTAATRALMTEMGVKDYRVVDTNLGAEKSSVNCEITRPDDSRVFLRGISTKHPKAVGSRVDSAIEFAYGDVADPSRLLIVRTSQWNETPRILKARSDLEAKGGTIISISDSDLRRLRAVQLCAHDDSPETHAWLRHDTPVLNTSFGKELLALIDPGNGTDGTEVLPRPSGPDSGPVFVDGDHAADPVDNEPTEASPIPDIVHEPDAIVLGRATDGSSVSIRLEELRKHVAVFASSGSGKTVFLRRIIEECALRGVSTIVLDPNNDLARLGDAWPSEPDTWWSGDNDRAREYQENTDVVVWTPGKLKGNPLTLPPFPDFSAVRDDEDELRLAVDTAVSSLAPRVRLTAATHAVDGRRAVLRETLLEFARHGGGDLDALIGLLNNLPEEIAGLPSAVKHGNYLASALSYARSNDPLFDGEGTPFDPDRLFTPESGKRARVSVINLAAIPEDNRPAFINRLQMALFSWIKRNPAKDIPLSGLFVMDEAQTFIPSGQTTPCTYSTRNLASQARKYGLGLIYATQAPRGIDSRITGNATTHIYGRVTVPAHIGAVNEIARARGEKDPLISQLTRGRFYASLEGLEMTEVSAPMCLSYHGSPLEETEITERSRGKGR